MLLREANALVDISSFIVQVISGTNFPVQALPRWLLPFSLALPLTYGFDAIRGLLLKTRTILPIPIEIGILIAFMVVFVAGWLPAHPLDRLETCKALCHYFQRLGVVIDEGEAPAEFEAGGAGGAGTGEKIEHVAAGVG